MVLLALGVVTLLILINALYVAAEFAMVGARRSRIQQLASEGNVLAQRLLPLIQNRHELDRCIAACQIGITISSLVLGAYGQATLAVWLRPFFEGWDGMQQVAAQSLSALVVLIGLTAVQMILGELVPKSVALQYPNRTALYTVLPVKWSVRLLSWFIRFLNGSGLAILKIVGAPQASHVHIHSPEEIEMLITESREGGLLDVEEHMRLRNALKLNKRLVQQLMVPRTQIKFIDVNTSIAKAVKIVAGSPYTRLPVFSGNTDTVLGLLHTKDLAIAYLDDPEGTSLEPVMRPVVHIPVGVTADRVITTLRERRSHQAIVVDEFGGVAGLITLEDILAEVLGQTADEFKTEELLPERLPDGRVRMPGSLRVDEASDFLGSPLNGDVDTVGGLVTQHLGHLPHVGERVTLKNIEFEVEAVVNRAVASLIATKVKSPHSAAPSVSEE